MKILLLSYLKYTDCLILFSFKYKHDILYSIYLKVNIHIYRIHIENLKNVSQNQ